MHDFNGLSSYSVHWTNEIEAPPLSTAKFSKNLACTQIEAHTHTPPLLTSQRSDSLSPTQYSPKRHVGTTVPGQMEGIQGHLRGWLADALSG